MIGMVAFTFATYTLSVVNPNKIGNILTDSTNRIKTNSFTNQQLEEDKFKDNLPDVQILKSRNIEIEANEKLLPYALIS
jgi:hypothetical protein